MHYDYRTKGVCAQHISFDINGDVITNISFSGGCNGNLKAISRLVDGWTVDKIEQCLRGNLCGGKPDLLRRPARHCRAHGVSGAITRASEFQDEKVSHQTIWFNATLY